ncbi:hypothetical protein CYJ29_08920 [Aerococcus loyolae]|uniref:Uncharacterized protein n=1 Tax=Aerococcus urinae TaxID=1376 RepID=A0A178HDA7_9LACT|nr:hypothetical protein [Aerococcus loyolae]OAM70400.1 hypothetical protein A1D21_08355 [Aerococcus loyolae]OFL14324.1 hypothetical protein HMPREF2784_00365 [Aerococcus loyolae]PKY81403.1 hypothetical protein CYJ30_08935 [Aerococcus loyolae]PKZ02894.1 hypothetical protein CYJ29_08920 [Aerococcus loyolae]RAV77216.1 hypothetical protein DBT54_09540 [Aerococcus loyolae]
MRKVEAIYPIVKTFFNDVTFNDNGYIFTVAYPKLLKNNKYFEETFFKFIVMLCFSLLMRGIFLLTRMIH